MKFHSEQNTYSISCGKATVCAVELSEISKIIGLRANARKFRALFDDVQGGMGGQHTCVHAVHVLLKQEYERIGATFDADAVESVRTVFWHAYAKLDASIEIIGDCGKIERLLKGKGARVRLADLLTDHPSVHQYLYATATFPRRALDRQALLRAATEQAAVIDLEAVAHRVFKHLQRPLLTLRLSEPSRSKLPCLQSSLRLAA